MKMKCLACVAMLMAATLMSAPSVRPVIPEPEIAPEPPAVNTEGPRQQLMAAHLFAEPKEMLSEEPEPPAEPKDLLPKAEEPLPAPTAPWREDVPLSAELQQVLLDTCAENGIDPLLMLGLIWTESRFVVDAVSSTGDYGLCQLNHNYFDPGMTPEENLRTGVGLLGQHLKTYGTIEAALTAYHWGHDNGTRGYAGTVISEAARYGYGQ